MFDAKEASAELDPIRREAVAWVQRLLSGEATSDDADALARWRARSPAHAAAFADASRVWGEIGRAAHGSCGEIDVAALVAGLRSRRMIARRAVLGGGLAAASAAAFYATAHPPLGLWPSWSELAADYRTSIGEQRQIALADHVSVRLNTQTSIALQASEAGADRVELIAGEASFTTAPQAVRALMVLAAGGCTVGSSARFDVRHIAAGAPSSVCVTCLDGRIRTEQVGETRSLVPGQRVIYDASGFGRVTAIDPDVAAAWQQGIVVFRATPLAEVVQEINRYRPGRIILMNAALAQKPVSGRFRIDQMNEILARLQQAFDARIRTLPGGVVLLG